MGVLPPVKITYSALADFFCSLLFSGFRAQITRFPSENFGIAVMSNEEDLGVSIMETVKYRIIDEVFKLEPVDWLGRHVPAVVHVFFFTVK